MTERCEQCYFWIKFQNPPPAGAVQKGECHRHAPNIFQRPRDEGNVCTKFPATNCNDGCGDFRPQNWRELREARGQRYDRGGNPDNSSNLQTPSGSGDWQPGGRR